MNEDLKGTMFDTTFDEYAHWTWAFVSTERKSDAGVVLAPSDSGRWIGYSHEASEILRDVPRKDLLSIASKRKGYG